MGPLSHSLGAALEKMMILVLDLEATCAEDGSIPPEMMEIIEVGACWAKPNGEVIDRFQSFVRPVERPELTPFCRGLTHITQSEVDAAPSWPEVSARFTDFAYRYGRAWGSWGAYDAKQIRRDCERHGIPSPLTESAHQNLKAQFAKNRKIKQVGMVAALKIVGLQLEGAHHRALNDAFNTARLLPWSLPPSFSQLPDVRSPTLT